MSQSRADQKVTTTIYIDNIVFDFVVPDTDINPLIRIDIVGLANTYNITINDIDIKNH